MIPKIAVSSRIINAIKLPLPLEEVRFSQRPRLGNLQLLEVIANFHELVIGLLEALINFSLP